MSIQSEIDRIKNNVTGTYSAISEMGGTVPSEQNSDNLAGAVRSIPQGTDFTIDETLEMSEDSVLGVTTPVKSVLTQDEFDALSEEEKAKGLYVIEGEGEDAEPINHNDLVGRDSNNQHPISSITGLTEALDSKAPSGYHDSDIAGINTRLDSVEDDISTLASQSDLDALESDVNNIKSELTSVYHYKGNVSSYSGLPSSNLSVGDVWNVEDTGMNYAWNGSDWDALGSIFDASQLESEIATKQNKLNGSQGQIVGFDESGEAVAQDAPSGGLTQEEADQRYLQLSGGTVTGDIILKDGVRLGTAVNYTANGFPTLNVASIARELSQGYEGQGVLRWSPPGIIDVLSSSTKTIIRSVASPVENTDAANKQYVDQAITAAITGAIEGAY